MAAGGGEGGIGTGGVAGEGVGLKYRWVVSGRLHSQVEARGNIKKQNLTRKT